MAAQPNYRQIARQAAERHGLDPDVFERQINQESGFNPHARSPAGAEGIAQIMPATARAWGVDPHDPVAALNKAAEEMAKYQRQFGSIRDALIAYNAGPGAVGKPLPAETQNYIRIILGGHGGGSAGAPHAAGISHLGEGPIKHKAVPGFSVDLPTSETSTTFDQAGFEEANRRSILGNYLAKHDPGSLLLRSGVLSTQTPSPGDFMRTETTTGTEKFTVPGSPASGGGGGSASSQAPAHGLAAFALRRADAIDAKHMPYLWGGGHGARITDASNATPLDCSGAVSAVLGIDPRVAAGFEHWGRPGDGGNTGVTIYAKDTHVLMKINGHFFGTSRSNPGGGAGWIPASALPKGYLAGFTVRHSDR